MPRQVVADEYITKKRSVSFNEEYRLRQLAALEIVDYVALVNEPSAVTPIEALRPDVYVKGGDYTVETVVGHEVVIASGGRVEIVPTVEGFSTTNIVKKLAANTMHTEEIQK